MFFDQASARESRTLAQRLADGRMPISEALPCAVQLAEALGKLHDEGRAHGALTPRCVILTGTKLEILPGKGAITPYTAPESLEGRTDLRSDVFSFGAILYEIMTARHAFEGEGLALMDALAGSTPEPTGSAIVDRLLAGCLAKNPEERWPRIHNVLTELKLLTAASRRTEAGSVDLAPLHAEIEQVEARLAARIGAHETLIASLQQAATETVGELRAQLAALEAHMASVPLQTSNGDVDAEIRVRLNAIEDRLAAIQAPAWPVQDSSAIDAFVAQRIAQSIQSMEQRIRGIEQSTAATRARFLEFERNVAADFHDFEIGLKAQEAAAEAVRNGVAQTDDLVDRVVEALGSIQAAVVEQTERRSMAAAN